MQAKWLRAFHAWQNARNPEFKVLWLRVMEQLEQKYNLTD